MGTDVWWNFDPRQIMVSIQLLIYGGYFVLRSALDEPGKRAKISAVFNLFAMTALPFLLYVIPRQMESLHPGAEGNPAFSQITHGHAVGVLSGHYWLRWSFLGVVHPTRSGCMAQISSNSRF